MTVTLFICVRDKIEAISGGKKENKLYKDILCFGFTRYFCLNVDRKTQLLLEFTECASHNSDGPWKMKIILLQPKLQNKSIRSGQ